MAASLSTFPYVYVVLRHTMPADAPRSSHWDLLFDLGAEMLKSWAVDALPDGMEHQEALELPDHRRLYLEYEGAISGDRGHVEKWDRGTCAVLAQNVRVWQFLLLGEKLRGIATFEVQNCGWTYRFVPDETPAANVAQ